VSLGAPELLIILLVVLLVFGGSQVPKLMRSLGSAQHEFKKGLDGHGEEDDDDKRKDSSKSSDTKSD
jgi:sec-independent protein translocase protein TatA